MAKSEFKGIDWHAWPEVPQALRPKVLYVAESLLGDARSHLGRLGWLVVDTRLLPAQTDSDRAEAVKAWLEGIRVGSIEPNRGGIKYLELEAKIYGLVGDKEKSHAPTTQILDSDALDKVLDFGRATKRVQRTAHAQGPVAVQPLLVDSDGVAGSRS